MRFVLSFLIHKTPRIFRILSFIKVSNAIRPDQFIAVYQYEANSFTVGWYAFTKLSFNKVFSKLNIKPAKYLVVLTLQYPFLQSS